VEWLEILRAECAQSSQIKIARRVGYSPAVVNQVLAGSYRGDLAAVQKAVEGALMGRTVECPILGALASHKCLEIQARPFGSSNPTRVALYKACRSGCPHSRLAVE
jgi:hypothetical protein